MTNLTEVFGSMAFNRAAMKKCLPEDAFNALMRTIDMGETLDLSIANIVAEAMKNWAVEKGVTHYTHWFQPINGVTAEKHESFINTSKEFHGVIMEFSGKALIRGESDASSFPSGGLRATFEARGYTAWDPTSYAFIKDGVLCIPTAFCSYGGEALDLKTPLLRSMEAINIQARRILALFGNPCGRVKPTVGAEQEYFLIDRDIYNSRKDLIYTGRTLFGAKPPKGQEMDDHYFGSIKIRISAFMKELDEELWRLGVLAKTKHNETAPAQHELAPIFTTVNVATDHNQVTMEIMRKMAKKHGLTCLLHEKPFAGLNGSGKHNNWSLTTDEGVNLFEPGDTPAENAQFLTFLCAVIKAVDEYQDLLRISVANAGNDHRLGGNEAPPAIISVYIGDELEAILDALASGRHYNKIDTLPLRVGVDALPPIPKDTTDRNRTSPFAFTGNKFEFRMLGSSQSIAAPNTVINTIVAQSLREFADRLEREKDFSASLASLIRETIIKHKRIIFNGNGYGENWSDEARRRGLLNLKSTAQALPLLLERKNIEVFVRNNVLLEPEIRSRYEILQEIYCKQINIEALVMSEMARRDIIPAVISFAGGLAYTISAKKALGEGISYDAELEILKKVSSLCDSLYNRTGQLDEAVAQAKRQDMALAEKALYFHDTVIERMDNLRAVTDELETICAKDAWPYPSYGRILYRV